MKRNFNISLTLIMYIQNDKIKIFESSYKHSKCLPDIYNMSRQKQTSFTVTPPRHGEAQDWRGDMQPWHFCRISYPHPKH